MFRMKGKFKNFNQGELYVYGLEGRGKIDTIHLAEGKFNYQIPFEDTLILSVIFPNFSEIPIIVTPNTTVKMEGDASHLREVKVNGSDENDLLTDFRLQVADMTPPQAQKAAEQFIKEHPASIICNYILNKYFLLKTDGDLAKAVQLLNIMEKAQPDNKRIIQLKQQVSTLRLAKKDSKLPKFKAVNTKGQSVSNADLNGDVNIINIWASWNYDSQSQQRELRRLQKKYGQRLGLLSICLDGNPAECKKLSERDSVLWSTICDGRMWKMPIVSQLNINAVPDNILTDRNGKIFARCLSTRELTKEIEEKLK